LLLLLLLVLLLLLLLLQGVIPAAAAVAAGQPDGGLRCCWSGNGQQGTTAARARAWAPGAAQARAARCVDSVVYTMVTLWFEDMQREV
jgi:hypothetical protein